MKEKSNYRASYHQRRRINLKSQQQNPADERDRPRPPIYDAALPKLYRS